MRKEKYGKNGEFRGKLKGKIGIGNNLTQVIDIFGGYSSGNYVWEIPGISGLCFELKDVEDVDDEWDELIAPIESIYVYDVNLFF